MLAVAIALLTLALNLTPTPRLGQDRPVNKQPIEIRVPSTDVPRLRRLLAKDPSIPASCGTRMTLVTALLSLGAPAHELVEAAGPDFCGPNPLIYYDLAAALNSKGEYLGEALQYAEWSARRYANDAIGPLDPTFLIASIRIKRGELDWVISKLSKTRDSDSGAFAWLGLAYEKRNQVDSAIEAYIRSVGAREIWSTIPPQGNYRRFAPLPDFHLAEMYRKRYGTLDGLDAKIELARRAARRALYVDPFRMEHPTFQWSLKDLDSRDVSLSNYIGKIVVLCFVPTEYEPRLGELKYFQSISEKYKEGGVIFLVVDVHLQRFPPANRSQNVAAALNRAGVTLPALLEIFDTVRKNYYMGGLGWPTGGVVIIDKQHTQAFLTGPVSQEYLTRITKILDYLLEEPVAPPT
jgi:tetratricopeptide (TPR) repeat protein